ncbi:tRNA uridine-5-carboxymethylaminomethyl(34) synthesis GTPase MnmE [Phenylobacterium sp.]|jgi:tRNA modification GTPase|uniref:tRNA uridine-5-carboxymethylaminomethyl(34) synthesis GTPase MnmE n=1 Tax=Phenylobacterium sp. TaxID=1871053 RepID=UPI0037C9D327
MTDTIYAAATAAGRAAVAVVRLSGPGTGAAVRALAGRLPRPRFARLRTLRDASGGMIDRALLLWFPGPGSYTGEDAAEFHVHGGAAVIEALLTALDGQGLRLAGPGEFTRRAFENGKLDLAQAEGVADLIEAETAAQRVQALQQLGGRLSDVQARWTEALTQALAMLEAAVDFPDEEVPADVASRARPVIEALIAELDLAVADAGRGQRVREGFRIALLGAPNAGKSTLLNTLAGRDAAIVTATPGTTRDIIEAPMVLGGYKVIVADTAGLRDTDDLIEAEGVRRARAWGDEADLRIWLADGMDPEASFDQATPGDICLITKRDLGEGVADLRGEPFTVRSPNDVAWLERVLTATVVEALSGSEPAAATRLRHRDLLTEAADRLRQALTQDENLELAAEDVRLAARALDRITGRIDPEQVLGRIFSTFCIGK